MRGVKGVFHSGPKRIVRTQGLGVVGKLKEDSIQHVDKIMSYIKVLFMCNGGQVTMLRMHWTILDHS